MKARLDVPPLGWAAKLADRIMVPIMYILSGTFRESPQSTHPWNIKKLLKNEPDEFDGSLMVRIGKADNSMKNRQLFLFHAPIFGGWRDYVVIEPVSGGSWYIGWKTIFGEDISRIELSGPVRVLKGPSDFVFFGVDAKTGEQIALREIGEGRVGNGDKFAKIKLL